MNPSRTPYGEALTEDQLDDLRHMVGAQSHIRKREWGFRNYYNATPGSPDDAKMKALHELGLVIPGARGYWHCTAAGCEAAGLNHAQTMRALHDD